MLATNRSRRATAAYEATSTTLPPVPTLIATFAGMERVIGEVRGAVIDRRIEDRFSGSMKLHRVLQALQSALDFEQGGDIAHDLNRLYDYFATRLHELNHTNDPEICDELEARFGELRQAWEGVASGPPKPNAVADTQAVAV